jgi:hypothetical protein
LRAEPKPSYASGKANQPILSPDLSAGDLPLADIGRKLLPKAA